MERRLPLLLSLLSFVACAGTARTRVEDTAGVRDVLDRASDAINHREWAALDALFTDDVVWEALPPVSWKLEGRAAIQKFLRTNATAIDVLLISVAASAIDLEGHDRARARSTMSELIRIRSTGAGLHVVGTYVDRLVKQDGKWRLAHRAFRPRFEDDVALPDRIFDGSGTATTATKAFPGAQ